MGDFRLDGIVISTHEIEFKEILNDGDWSASYLVNIHGTQYAMKVHFIYPEHLEGEQAPVRSEIKAYQRLQSHGLSDKGYIPQFHGVIEDFDRDLLPSPAPACMEESLGACAILLEYIPGLQQLNAETYTEERWETVLRILGKIHEAGVLHNDAGQYNIGFSTGEERVLWLDFDMATTFDEQSGQTRWQQEQLMAQEMEIVASMLDSAYRNT